MKKDEQKSFIFGSGGLSPFDSVKVKEEPSQKEKIQSNNPTIEEGKSKEGSISQVVEADDLDLFARPEKKFTETVNTVESDESDTTGEPDGEKPIDSTVEPVEGDVTKNSDSEVEDGDEDDDDINIYYYMAKQLQGDGELPSDFDIEENVSGKDIYDTYKKSLYDDVRSEITQEVLNHLRENGINDQDLRYAKLIRSGVDLNTLSATSNYERLSSIDLESSDMTSKQSLIREMYKDKGMEKDEIDMLIETADVEDKTDSFAKKAKDYFYDKSIQILKQEQDRVQAIEKRNAEINKQREKQINAIWDSKELLGEEIKDIKGFKKSVYERSVSENIEGKVYQISEFEKFLYDFESDPEVKLWAFKKFKYKDEDATDLKQKIKAEVEEDFFSGYKQDYVKKRKNPLSSKQVKKKLEDSTNKGYTIFNSESGLFEKI